MFVRETTVFLPYTLMNKMCLKVSINKITKRKVIRHRCSILSKNIYGVIVDLELCNVSHWGAQSLSVKYSQIQRL